ncbi:MAG: hypothetical protein EOP05_23925 [Proteobacteria bacterium]|nr:MAG: hypothetical protein EOP05_23925 [Pseudomonadota bacterium]
MKNTRLQNRFASFLMLSASMTGMAAGTLSVLATPSAAYAQTAGNFGSAFVNGGQITPLVNELKQAIAAIAPRHGLSPRDYWTPNLPLSKVSLLNTTVTAVSFKL